MGREEGTPSWVTDQTTPVGSTVMQEPNVEGSTQTQQEVIMQDAMWLLLAGA